MEFKQLHDNYNCAKHQLCTTGSYLPFRGHTGIMLQISNYSQYQLLQLNTPSPPGSGMPPSPLEMLLPPPLTVTKQTQKDYSTPSTVGEVLSLCAEVEKKERETLLFGG